MSETTATYTTEGRDPMPLTEPRNPYDWRAQPTAEEAVQRLTAKMEPRHREGISTYGPFFQGDPLDNAEEEILDDWHYLQAGRRQRDAYALALWDILVRIEDGDDPSEVIGDAQDIIHAVLIEAEEAGRQRR